MASCIAGPCQCAGDACCRHHAYCHAGKLNQEHGWEIKIHIDGASGGFIAPFQYPDLLWCASLRAAAETCTLLTIRILQRQWVSKRSAARRAAPS